MRLLHALRLPRATVRSTDSTLFHLFKSREIEELEADANADRTNAKKQALLYSELLDDDPSAVIRRFEDPKFARDKECAEHYLSALEQTGEVERAAKFMGFKESLSEIPFLLGSKERPLYVKAKGSLGGGDWFGTLVNIMLFGAAGFMLFSVVEQKIKGFSGTAHQQFSPDSNKHSFDDVQGCDEAKLEMQEIVEFLKNPSKFNKLGARMPKGVLLAGPPGTGKTLLAKAVAGEANVPFYYAAGSSFEEMFVGVGSKRIREMFETAKQNAPSIIFIDELDAIGSKRNPRDPQNSRMGLNQLLTELDGFSEASGVVVIAATNIPEALDKALLRPGRFDKHVFVSLPDMRGRESILQMYLSKVQLASDVDVKVLAKATPGFSGADLSKLVNQAKIAASVQNKRIISMKHLEESKDEMIMGTERKSKVIGPEDKQLTAYHEGGHAIMALNTKHAMPIHKATIIPRGSALGMVTQLPEKDELSLTKSQLLARMDVAMGGRVAEELMFGPENVTTGAMSDFQQATAIARAMVTQYGMSDKIGPVAISPEEYEILSPAIKELIDSEAKALLEQSRQRAIRTLSDRKRDLEKLAKALIEYETLTRAEIEQLLHYSHHAVDQLYSM